MLAPRDGAVVELDKEQFAKRRQARLDAKVLLGSDGGGESHRKGISFESKKIAFLGKVRDIWLLRH
ncbi:MAG: hypothetical protein CTY36_03910 [Methylocystis sp.]|nr:MAG: hypothetical protein CTY36_03910 [Methylocystis sp.]PWB90040.1 hypothetical protein C5688_11970 [Methylocystis sp. MitZ-2018]